MKTAIAWGGIAAIVLAASGYGVHQLGVRRGLEIAAPSRAADADPAAGRTILYWQDPMVPGQRFDKPGKSPFMDMPLVPVYAEPKGEGSVTIDPRMQQNLGVRTAEVREAVIAAGIDAVGSVAYNERDVAVVQARANGFLERLHVRAPLDPVRKGQTLAEIYVPDWVAAQEEYLAARRIAQQQSDTASLAGLVDGARQRMRLAGMTDAQIRTVEADGIVRPRMTVTAPIGGVVGELAAREGMTVMTGAPLFRVNGLSTVWVNAEVPENAAARVLAGAAVDARTAALPGRTYKGAVSAILPAIDPATRTIKARIELANPDGRLVPGMFVTVSFTPAAGKPVLLVPTEAVIQTGTRSVVIVALDDGRFTPIDVEVGIDTGGETEIRGGLQAGQKIVVSGQFLLDSEANLRAATTRMGEAPGGAKAKSSAATGVSSSGAASASVHRAEGTVEAIEHDGIMVSHGAIASLGWGPMTMGFRLASHGVPAGIAVGDHVRFEFRSTPDGGFEISSIARMPAPATAPRVKP